MAGYNAPLRDMEFVTNELADLGGLAGLPGHGDVSPELIGSVLEAAGKFATEVLAPLNQSGDQQGSKLAGGAVTTPKGFKQAYERFVADGWNGLALPAEFGGQGLPQLVSAAVAEMWHASNMSFALCPMLTQGAAEALLLTGSDALKRAYLPKMVSGEWTGTMNLTEPQAGSDLAAVRTRAVPEADHYRLTGQKIFITYGDHDWTGNIIHMVLARTPDAPPGVKGISLFLVPKVQINADGSLGAANDVHCVSLEHKLGIHASPTAALSYGDKGGARGWLVGQENHGLAYMFIMMNLARFNVGVQGLGIAERAWQQARSYAAERVQGGDGKSKGSVTIVHHPDVRRMLMSMRARVEAMRALCYVTARQLDEALHGAGETQSAQAQAFVDLMIPVVKGWCTESAQEITSIGVQVHGGMGYIEETGAAQYYRDARISTIYEGTTGIQAKDLLGRKLLRDKGATAKVLIGSMRADCAKLSGQGEMLEAVRARFAAGIDAVEQSAVWLLANNERDPDGTQAGAVPFLMLLGTVAGGWQMARAASIAQQRLRGGAADPFYQAKLVTARFYADHELTRAPGLGEAITRGSGSVMGLATDQF